MAGERWLSPTQAAKAIGYSKSRVYQWIHDGDHEGKKLPAFLIHCKWQIRLTDLLAYVNWPPEKPLDLPPDNKQGWRDPLAPAEREE